MTGSRNKAGILFLCLKKCLESGQAAERMNAQINIRNFGICAVRHIQVMNRQQSSRKKKKGKKWKKQTSTAGVFPNIL